MKTCNKIIMSAMLGACLSASAFAECPTATSSYGTDGFKAKPGRYSNVQKVADAIDAALKASCLQKLGNPNGNCIAPVVYVPGQIDSDAANCKETKTKVMAPAHRGDQGAYYGTNDEGVSGYWVDEDVKSFSCPQEGAIKMSCHYTEVSGGHSAEPMTMDTTEDMPENMQKEQSKLIEGMF